MAVQNEKRTQTVQVESTEFRAVTNWPQNTPKQYETHQNMSLVSNGVDRVCSLRKSLMRLLVTNFCINYSTSARFAPSFMK